MIVNIILIALACIAVFKAAGLFSEIGSKLSDAQVKRSESKVRLAEAKRKMAEAEEIKERTRNMAIKVKADVMRSLAESKKIVEESKYKAVTGKSAVVIDNRTGRVGHYITPPTKLLMQQDQQHVEDGPNHTAIEVGLEIDRAFVWGPTRGGKTFFCKQLSYHLVGRAIFVIY